MSKKLMVCATALALVLGQLALAQQVVFFADFEDSSGVNNPANWIPDNGGQNWATDAFPGSGNGLRQTVEGCGISGNTPFPGVTDFQDGVIQLDMSWDDDDSWGIVLRKTADDAGYLVVFGYIETPAILIADLADGCANTGQCLDQAGCENGGAELIQVPHTLGSNLTQDLSVSYTGRIEVDGDTIRVWYLPTADVTDPLGDFGEPLVEFQHSAHAGPGSVGIWHESQGGSMIDNVYIFGGDPALAFQPSPGNGGADVPWYVDTLSWSAGETAQSHNVYFSTNADEVNTRAASALVGEGLTETSLSIETELETTYYWAVDEVEGATVYPGDTWSFTTEAVANLITGVSASADSEFSPDNNAGNLVNGSGMTDGMHSTVATDMWLSAGLPATVQFDLGEVYSLHEMHVWNQNQLVESLLGFSAKDITIEVSTNGTDYIAVDGVGPLNQGTGMASAANSIVALNGVLASSLRLTVTSAYGFLGQAGLSEVQFTAIPAFPREFRPADGATVSDLDVTLGWRGGRFGIEHQVLLSQDRAAVADGSAVIATTADKSYALSGLEYGGIYFTRIIDVGADGTNYAGPINYFITAPEKAIDDMEAYADEADKEIWATWVDGFDDPANGSLVGNGASGAPETGEVYEGSQSLPMSYDLTSAGVAEATRTFSPALDLTAGSADTVGVYFKGDGPEMNGFYSTDGNTWIAMSWNPQKVSTSGDNLIGLAVTSHDVAVPTTAVFSNISTTGNVTGDWMQADIGGTHPAGMFTEAGGTISVSAQGADIWTQNDEFRFVYKTLSGDGSITARVDSLETVHDWAKAGVMIRDTDATNASYGIVCATGVNGTRYQARLSTNASAVSDSGVLDGIQQLTEEPVWVRIERQSVNDGASVYMVLTDTSGNSAKISHPDADATLASDWTLISANISDLSGVNPSRIASVTVGVEGASGDTGRIFVDYLHVGTVIEPANIYLEAEAADVLGASWRLVDDAAASGGQRIGSEDGDGNDNGSVPGPEWMAAYNFEAPVAGIYNVVLRGMEAGSDSFWVRIVGSLGQSNEHPGQAGTGWVRFNGFNAPNGLAWDKVHSNDHSNAVTNFILPAGPLTLEVGKREDGVYADAFLITNDLGVDQGSLPDAIPAP